MWTKHLVSVIDMIFDFPAEPEESVINEKIGDSINYLILLEALLKENVVYVKRGRETVSLSGRNWPLHGAPIRGAFPGGLEGNEERMHE